VEYLNGTVVALAERVLTQQAQRQQQKQKQQQQQHQQARAQGMLPSSPPPLPSPSSSLLGAPTNKSVVSAVRAFEEAGVAPKMSSGELMRLIVHARV
jgi:hypothetical protein